MEWREIEMMRRWRWRWRRWRPRSEWAPSGFRGLSIGNLSTLLNLFSCAAATPLPPPPWWWLPPPSTLLCVTYKSIRGRNRGNSLPSWHQWIARLEKEGGRRWVLLPHPSPSPTSLSLLPRKLLDPAHLRLSTLELIRPFHWIYYDFPMSAPLAS